jgi:hypothetical protein
MKAHSVEADELIEGAKPGGPLSWQSLLMG